MTELNHHIGLSPSLTGTATEALRHDRESTPAGALPVERVPRHFPLTLLSAGICTAGLFGLGVWLWGITPMASLVAAWLISPLIIMVLGVLIGVKSDR